MINTLKQLINISSVTGHEELIAKYVADYLVKNDLSPQVYDNNIVCKVIDKEPSITLVGHLDTVPPALNQSISIVAGDLVYGRGACDMKAGLTVMLELAGLKEAVHGLNLVFYAAEEGPLPNGLTELIEHNRLDFNSQYIVLEPTNCVPMTACRGRLLSKIVVKGKATHSYDPSLGDNAIIKASKLIQKINDSFVIGESMCVTNINTFNPDNQIPDHCELMIDYRYRLGDLSYAKARLKELLGQHLDYEFIDESEGCQTIPKNLLINFVDSFSCNSIFPAWCDIAQLNNNGYPAIVFGPGKLDLAHTDNEHVSIKSMNEAYNALRKFLTE